MTYKVIFNLYLNGRKAETLDGECLFSSRKEAREYAESALASWNEDHNARGTWRSSINKLY